MNVFALQGVGINGEHQKFGIAETPLSWDGRNGWLRDTNPSPTSHHVKFGSSATKSVRM